MTRTGLLSGVLLAGSVLFAGWPALTGGLIRDDALYMLLNPDVVEPTSPLRAFQTPFQPDYELGLYRPLTTLSLRWDFVLSWALGIPISSDRAPVPHATNLLLAVVAALLLYRLGRHCGFGGSAAFMAALWFAVHPARSEATFWISGRAENLMTVFALGALVVAAHPAPSRWRPPAVGALALLSFFSKEQGITVLAPLLLLPGLPPGQRYRRWGAAAMALGAGLWIRHQVVGVGPTGAQQVLPGTSIPERVELALGWLFDYVRLCFWPHPLLNEYGPPSFERIAAPILGGLLAAAILTGIGRGVWSLFSDQRRDFRSARRTACFLSLFAAPLVLVLNLFYRTGETFAERFLALPLAGACLMVVRWIALRPRLGGFVSISVAILFLALSRLRAPDYRNEAALTEALTRDAPHMSSSWRLQSGTFSRRASNLRSVLEQLALDGSTTAALKQLEGAHAEERAVVADLLAVDRTSRVAALEAELRSVAGQREALLRKALEVDSTDAEACMDMATVLLERGRPKSGNQGFDLGALREAAELAERVAISHPDAVDGHLRVAQVALVEASILAGPARQALLAKAVPRLQRVLEINPRVPVAVEDLISVWSSTDERSRIAELLEDQAQAYEEISATRWWDPHPRERLATVVESLGRLQSAPLPALDRALELRMQALALARQAPERTRLLAAVLATVEAQKSFGASPPPPGVDWGSEIERLERLRGSARIASDLLASIGMLEERRGRLDRAADAFERASRASTSPDATERFLRTAARTFERRALGLGEGEARRHALAEARRIRVELGEVIR